MLYTIVSKLLREYHIGAIIISHTIHRKLKQLKLYCLKWPHQKFELARRIFYNQTITS